MSWFWGSKKEPAKDDQGNHDEDSSFSSSSSSSEVDDEEEDSSSPSSSASTSSSVPSSSSSSSTSTLSGDGSRKQRPQQQKQQQRPSDGKHNVAVEMDAVPPLEIVKTEDMIPHSKGRGDRNHSDAVHKDTAGGSAPILQLQAGRPLSTDKLPSISASTSTMASLFAINSKDGYNSSEQYAAPESASAAVAVAARAESASQVELEIVAMFQRRRASARCPSLQTQPPPPPLRNSSPEAAAAAAAAAAVFARPPPPLSSAGNTSSSNSGNRSNHSQCKLELQRQPINPATQASRTGAVVDDDMDYDDEDDDIDSTVEEQVLSGIIPELVDVQDQQGVEKDADRSLLAAPGGAGKGNRARLPSALSMTDDPALHDNDVDEPNDRTNHKTGSRDCDDFVKSDDEMDNDEDDSLEGAVTSLEEKRSLLLLAAEHDRVDILQAILAVDDQDDATDRDTLLSSAIPPLHVAVSYGSVSATNCLLRMGADPSIRPNVAEIQQQQQHAASALSKKHAPVKIPNMARFDGRSAWELVFGDGSSDNNNGSDQISRSNSGWALFRSPNKSGSNSRRCSSIIIDLPPSKREGLRHAFTAEALRCIGSDESDRLQQLLQASMPADITIGGKTLYDWSVEMSASQCEALLRPSEAARYDAQQQLLQENISNGTVAQNSETPMINGNDDVADTCQAEANAGGHWEDDSSLPLSKDYRGLSEANAKDVAGADTMNCDSDTNPRPGSNSRMLDRSWHRDGSNKIRQYMNRLDELESLSRALSICLDNLAEEVSVSSGLLLVGSGASALASHVRSLKATRDRKYEELLRWQEAWENLQDELAYWVKEAGDVGKMIAEKMIVVPTNGRRLSAAAQGSEQPGDADEDALSKEQQQLQAQIAASENKVIKLRAYIADLSEENARNLAEVARRGLTGGIKLVRDLRDEIREIDFQLAEIKSAEAANQTKISLIQTRMKAKDTNPETRAVGITNGITSSDDVSTPRFDDDTTNRDTSSRSNLSQTRIGHTMANGSHNEMTMTTTMIETRNVKNSERIATGQSTALVVRTAHDGSRGYFPLNLWQILLRIMGLGEAGGVRENDQHHHEEIDSRRPPVRGSSSLVSNSAPTSQPVILL